MKTLFNHWDWKLFNNKNNYSNVNIINNEEQIIIERINKRFSIMRRMIKGMIHGNVRSLIISGASGVGKTYDVEQILKESSVYTDIIKGTISAVGLYTALYKCKKNGIIVLDDCDNVFKDEQALNILKAALDSSDIRTISWRKSSSWLNKVENTIPDSFQFTGGIIFITNIDFMEKINKKNKMGVHCEALMSRSLYLDLSLRTIDECLIRIKDIFLNKMIKIEKLNITQGEEIINFIVENKDKISELSLRTLKHIAQLYKFSTDWKDIVKITKFKKE
jgi:hypothetical protein